jgi:hypothetical protein
MIEELTRADPGELVQSLQILKSLLKDNPIHNYEDCVHWARQQFDNLFNYKIRDLLHSHPEDYVTGEGVPFWSGYQRAPTPLQYDPNNEYHAEFKFQCSTGNPIQMKRLCHSLFRLFCSSLRQLSTLIKIELILLFMLSIISTKTR